MYYYREVGVESMKLYAFLLLILLLTACGSGSADYPAGGARLTPQEAQDMLTTHHVLLLDVRTPAEFYEVRIHDALHLPLGEIEARAASVLPNKDQVIFVYCRAGNRSRTATDLLVSMGYTQVFDIGAVFDWLGELVREATE